MTVWTGRDDVPDEGPLAVRWHQQVRPWAAGTVPGVVLIGFACDEGVRRNSGRVGASGGPRAIRRALANMAWHLARPVYDAGDVVCPDGDLESAQERLAELVACVTAHGCFPLVIGGGHETSWGTHLGLTRARPGDAFGVINFDAHFDLRSHPRATSGTPFRQIADRCRQDDRPFRYLCLGIAEAANTAALFEKCKAFGVSFVSDHEMASANVERLANRIAEFEAATERVHVSLDLDVLPPWVMPAVSAPSARGVPLDVVEGLLGRLARSVKIAALDVVEFNPAFDTDHRAARTVAGVIARFASLLSSPKESSS
jgi:formiminoglutamase